MEQKTWLSKFSLRAIPRQKRFPVILQVPKLYQMQILGLAGYFKYAVELANNSSGFPLSAIDLHGFTGESISGCALSLKRPVI